jgi:hypothetical protein
MHSPESNCQRKIRHEDYWSALCHAATIPDNATVVIYPCPVCLGIHCGHGIDQPSKLIRKLTRTERKIALAEAGMEALVQPLRARNQQRLKDLRRHMEWMKPQIALAALACSVDDNEAAEESPMDEVEQDHSIFQRGWLQGPRIALRLPASGGLLRKLNF